MNLCVIVLTTDLEKETKPPKILPKVCYKVGEKTMIEICLENVVRLNPVKIILLVSKHTIFYINKVLKHTEYVKLISFCIIDNQFENANKISLSKKCYSGKNVLVVPANSPLLTSRGMYKLISLNKSVKASNNLFYLKKDELDRMDSMAEYPSNEILSKKEMMQVRTQRELEYVQDIFDVRQRINKNIINN